MNRQRRKIKSKRQLKKTSNERLERETRKLVSKANARLDSLQRRYKSGTYASKKLANRLDTSQLKAWSKSGKIKIRKNATKTQLLAINKATTQFLNSKTSTKKGISHFKKEQIENIKLRRSIDDEDFTEEDAEDFFDMFGDNDFDFFASKIGASTLQEIIYDAIREGDSEDDFISRLELYIEINDLDIREKAIRLYNKYVM